MNRSRYFNLIEDRLSALAYRIDVRGKLNLLELHVHSEDFYQRFLNLLFRWNLRNLNAIKHNVEAIDLIDKAKRIVAQVSATATKAKIESALGKDLSLYRGYSFKFISISKDADKLRNKNYKNPHGLKFVAKTDIFDIPALLRMITDLDIDHQREVWEFIRKELQREIEPERVESNLATIIGILAGKDWKQDEQVPETRAFKIDEKISYNQLDAARCQIDDYVIHSERVTSIYEVFDRQGANRSQSVLNAIRHEYATQKNRNESADELFFKIVDLVKARVLSGVNFEPIPVEELDLCVGILVVDAFVRCKIFENPPGASHAAP